MGLAAPAPSTPSRPLHDCSDAALVDALRAHHPTACAEFFARFRPLLERAARRMGIPRWEWPTCVTDVLSDAALWFLRRSDAAPRALGAYLVRAVRHRYIRLKRDAARRAQRAADLAHDRGGEVVVVSACSEFARRASAGPAEETPSPSAALSRLAHELRATLTAQERTILAWLSDGASHREIAAWLGARYDATTKRIWRLCRRLRTVATDRVARCSDAERHELARFFRRAGVLA